MENSPLAITLLAITRRLEARGLKVLDVKTREFGAHSSGMCSSRAKIVFGDMDIGELYVVSSAKKIHGLEINISCTNKHDFCIVSCRRRPNVRRFAANAAKRLLGRASYLAALEAEVIHGSLQPGIGVVSILTGVSPS